MCTCLSCEHQDISPLGEGFCMNEYSIFYLHDIKATDENDCHSSLIEYGESWASAEEV